MTTETDVGGQDEGLRSAQSQPISDGLRPTTSGAEPSAAKRAPVQGYSPGIPWEMHLRAYDAYCKRWSSQPALIDLEGRNCRGGFGTEELDEFIPGWRDELSDRRKMEAALQSAQSEAAALRVERDEWKHAAEDELSRRQNLGRAEAALRVRVGELEKGLADAIADELGDNWRVRARALLKDNAQ